LARPSAVAVLAITYPENSEMQVRAIIRRGIKCQKAKRLKYNYLRFMIPAHGSTEERMAILDQATRK